jgi:acyl-CoA reductase-like NAD-dependent aldehyde dehydrogenase
LKEYFSQNMGQNCIGIERLLVHSSQYDELHDILVERVARLRPGSVLAPSPEGYLSTIDCGSMINGDRFLGLAQIIRDAAEGGAMVDGGASQYHHAYLENGYYFGPTVVGPVEVEMDIAKKECA